MYSYSGSRNYQAAKRSRNYDAVRKSKNWLLSRKRLNQKSLPAAKERSAIDGGLFKGVTSTSGTGGGIASPLTEDDNARTYFDATELRSSDGLFIMEIMHIQSADFVDANSNPLHIDFDNPDTTQP